MICHHILRTKPNSGLKTNTITHHSLAPPMNRLSIVITLAILLAGCDMASTIKDGVEKSNAVAELISKDCGTKPEVGFNYFNGQLSTVTIQFKSMPQKNMVELQTIAKKEVKAAFGAEPDNLIIAFSFPKNQTP